MWRLSLVIPVYNEVEALPALFGVLRPILDGLREDYEIICVDDGSQDGTADFLSDVAAMDPRVKILTFSRNFGHQAAITAGLDFASGDAVVVMDADLQDPPELIPEMIALYRQGYDVISAQRISRTGEGIFKLGTAKLFYWMIRKTVESRVVSDVGDFRLFSRAAVVALRRFRERHRFMRGLVAWLGLREIIVPFHRARRIAGKSKYPTVKMIGFAWTAISSFSTLPLRLVLGGGMMIFTGGIMYALYVVYATLVLKTTVPGWSSLVCLQVLLSGSTLAAIGLVGDYVARIFEESKGRPLYVVTQTSNIPANTPSPHGALVIPPRDGGLASAHTGPTHGRTGLDVEV